MNEEPGKKPKTPLFSPETGKSASVVDASSWGTFAEALDTLCQYPGHYGGIGFVLTDRDPFSAIDLDDCINAHGEVADWAWEIVCTLNSYTEISPSGSGLRILCKGSLPGTERKKGDIEMYDSGRHVTITGNHYPGTPTTIEERQEALESVHARVFNTDKQDTRPQSHSSDNSSHTADDISLLTTARSAENGAKFIALYDHGDTSGYPSPIEADFELCGLIACYTGPDPQRIETLFRSSKLYRDRSDQSHHSNGDIYDESTIERGLDSKPSFDDANYNGAVDSSDSFQEPLSFEPHNYQEPPLFERYDYQELLPFELYDYPAEQGGILQAWLDHYSLDWIYDPSHKNWFHWNEKYWQVDTTRNLRLSFQNLLKSCNTVAAARKQGAEASYNSQTKRQAEEYVRATKRDNSKINSLEAMAMDHKAINYTDFNSGNLLNLANGTLDLDTLELRPHSRADYLDYCQVYDYDPEAKCPTWLQFIHEVLVHEETLEPDHQTISLYQELVGYSLTTSTDYEVMIWQHGLGANGKTVAAKVLEALLGPLSRSVNFQMIGKSGNYDLAALPGKRIIFSTESERNEIIIEGLLKQIVSGETISTRAIYSEPFEFRPVAKIWWSMNDLPKIRDTSNGMWRRLIPIPFYRTFTEEQRDSSLAAKLLQELPGILNWSLEGLIRLRQQGKFSVSESVNQSRVEYRTESNPVAVWLEERTEKVPGSETQAATLYYHYMEWCQKSGYQSENITHFGTELKRLGITGKRKSSGVHYNLRLLPYDTSS